MKKIIFITSGSINYQLPSFSLYQSLKRTAAGQSFPGLTPAGKAQVAKSANRLACQSIGLIVSAPSRQCRQTAAQIGGILHVPIRFDQSLLPLRFDLSRLISPAEFNNLGNQAYTVLRTRFLRAFFANQLLQNNRLIARRFKKLVRYFTGLTDNTNILVISHAYPIKLLQIYSILGENMYSDYQKLSAYFSPGTVTMQRLETVEIVIPYR